MKRIRASHVPSVLFFCLCLSGFNALAQLPVVQFGIAAEGRIVPGDGLLTVGAHPGAILHSLEVKTGDSVKQGDLLARLSSYPAAQSAVTRARLEAESLNAAVAAAQAEVGAAEAAVAAAQAQVLIAEKQSAEARSAVAAAQAAQTRALAEHDATARLIEGQIAEHQRVLDELDPPRREREELRVKQNMLRLETQRLANTRSALEAELQAAIAQAGAAAETAASSLEAARASHQQAQAQAEASQAGARQIQIQAEGARAAIAQAEAEARTSEVRAAIDGQIIAINTRPGEQVGQQGILFLGDTSRMYVEAQIYVDDIRRLRTGQQATISGSALEGNLSGTVEEIGLMVTPANLYHPDFTIFTDRRVVIVRISLEDSEPVSRLTHAQVTVRINPSRD